MKVTKKSYDSLMAGLTRTANTASNAYNAGRTSVFGGYVLPFIIPFLGNNVNPDFKMTIITLFCMMYGIGMATCEFAHEKGSHANKKIAQLQSIMAGRASR